MAVTTSSRLGRATVAGLPAGVRPPVEVERTGIVHIGLGAFHRAHQAVHTEDAVAAAGGDWGIAAVAPRSRDVLDPLAAQDRLYGVLAVGPDGVVPRVVGVHTELLHAASDPAAVVARLADPAVRIVTLTVTEKAYHLDPATGRPCVDGALLADLTTDRPPGTVAGMLVRALVARAGSGAPLAVVSCDNLPDNGRRLESLVTAALEVLADPAGVRRYVAEAVTFPATMVDRMVPATTAGTIDLAARALGVRDLVPVRAEPFSQWVIEDDFPGGRPAWERAGAVLTDDVAPWEGLKLRILNCGHSALAYLGAPAGAPTIADALRLPGAVGFLDRLVTDDVAPTLTPPPGQTVEGYAATARARFANPALGHRTLQVAMDGSQKLPQRLFGTIADRRAAGALPERAVLVLAAWLWFVRGTADDGTRLPLDDPLADRLRAAVTGAPDTPDGLTTAVFGLDGVLPAELVDDDEVRACTVRWLGVLARGGARAALAEAGGT